MAGHGDQVLLAERGCTREGRADVGCSFARLVDAHPRCREDRCGRMAAARGGVGPDRELPPHAGTSGRAGGRMMPEYAKAMADCVAKLHEETGVALQYNEFTLTNW